MDYGTIIVEGFLIGSMVMFFLASTTGPAQTPWWPTVMALLMLAFIVLNVLDQKYPFFNQQILILKNAQSFFHGMQNAIIGNPSKSTTPMGDKEMMMLAWGACIIILVFIYVRQSIRMKIKRGYASMCNEKAQENKGITRSYKTNISGQNIEICFSKSPNSLLLPEEKIREDIQTKIDKTLEKHETSPDPQEYKKGSSKMYVAIGELKDLLKRPAFKKTMFTMDGLYYFQEDTYMAAFEGDDLQSLYEYLKIMNKKFDRYSPKIQSSYWP